MDSFVLTIAGEVVADLKITSDEKFAEYPCLEATVITHPTFDSFRDRFARELQLLDSDEDDDAEEWASIWDELKQQEIFVESADRTEVIDIMWIHFKEGRAWWWPLYHSEKTYRRASKREKIVVPQANSWETFDQIFDLVAGGLNDNIDLGERMNMAPRAVAYYIQLGEWLDFFDRGELSARGHRYRLDEHDKTLAKEAMLSHEWFEDAVAVGEDGDLVAAFEQILSQQTDLSPATISRRAGGLAQLWKKL